MAIMRVKDLIESLQKLDPELPIHRRANAGNFEAIDIDQAGYTFTLKPLMQSKNDMFYYADAEDKLWKSHRDQFHDIFQAVVIN